MKDNNHSVGGHLVYDDKNRTYESYANYFVKFLDAYIDEGINLWSLSVQNEPLFSVRWQSLLFDGQSQRTFISDFLGPKLRQKYPDLKLMVHDDQRPFLLSMAVSILGDGSDSPASKFVDGFGVHWYASLYDYINEFGYLAQCHEKYPDKFILATEACTGFLPWENKPILGDWTRGEYYSYDIIGDLENWANGWVDWNLALDPQGGPNHVSNFVDSPIIIDVSEKNRYWRQPMFYHMAHFSKFITPGSVRVKFDTESSFLKRLDVTTWLDKSSQKLTVVLLNRNSWFDVTYRINVPGTGYYEGKIEKKSIQTIVFQLTSSVA